ncbi:unnamed protein product, partial [Meganyctiphanes norvegica]
MRQFCSKFICGLQTAIRTWVKNTHQQVRSSSTEQSATYRSSIMITSASSAVVLASLPPVYYQQHKCYRIPILGSHDSSLVLVLILTKITISVDSAICTSGHNELNPIGNIKNDFIFNILHAIIYFFNSVSERPVGFSLVSLKKTFQVHDVATRYKLKPHIYYSISILGIWFFLVDFNLFYNAENGNFLNGHHYPVFVSIPTPTRRTSGNGFPKAQGQLNHADLTKKSHDVVMTWHTNRALIEFVRVNSHSEMIHQINETSVGEGFSYIRIPIKQPQNKEEQDQQPKRTLTGTEADLRRLSHNNAINILKQYGIPEKETKKLTRWEAVDVVRTLSTEMANAGEEGTNKFSRNNRFSITEHQQEIYLKECQRIFDLQNRVLASEEVLSTDEGSSGEENHDSDIEENRKYIGNILVKNKKSHISMGKEELPHKELVKLKGEDDKDKDLKKQTKIESDENEKFGFGTPGRVLRITRTFKTPDGKEYTRTELVRKTAFIDAYVKIRLSKDENFINSFTNQLDEIQIKDMRRLRRQIQERQRRVKRNQERIQNGIITPPKPKKPKLKPDLKLTCGACGQIGHMRTNKACPLYVWVSPIVLESKNMAMTEEQENMEKLTLEESEDLVIVDGTKIKFSSKVIRYAEELKRQPLVLKVPKGQIKVAKRRRAGTVDHCDYLKKKERSVNRRRFDPVVTLSTIFEDTLNDMREMIDVQHFLFPVNQKILPDYYNIIHNPMDLSTIRENLRIKKYQSREDFLSEISQIVENSKIYNGLKSILTGTSQKMLDFCINQFNDKEENLMRLEKAINPLLDDDQVAFSYILNKIMNERLLTMSESWPFLKPVPRKKFKDYYNIIQHPMELATISKKVEKHKYHSRAYFMADLELIEANSIEYNGKESLFTQKAQTLIQVAKESLQEWESDLVVLETQLAFAQERALDQADTESLSISLGSDDNANNSFADTGSEKGDKSQKPPSYTPMDLMADEVLEHRNVVDSEETEVIAAKRQRLELHKDGVEALKHQDVDEEIIYETD